jgi:hypothetical protein
MFDKFPSYILEEFSLPILIIIFIKVVFKINILLTIMLIVLIFLYYNLELFIIPQNNNDNKIIRFCAHDISHLGDHIFNIFLLNKLKKYIENNNITVQYYGNKKYHREIEDMKNSKNVIIYDFKPLGYHLNIFNLWNSTTYDFAINFIYDLKTPYDILYKELYNKCLEDLKISIKFDNFYNEDNSLLTDYNNLSEKYKDIDILVINSIPLSNQFFIDEKEWDDFIIELNNKYKIVTTKKVKDIPCTWDDKLTIKKIAAISTNAKVIIAINTGPTSGIFNIYTLNNCRKIYIFDNRVNYTTIPQLENLNYLKDIDFENLDKIIIKKNL